MNWTEAKAELERLAGPDRSNCLEVNDWTFCHSKPPYKEIIFRASIEDPTGFIQTESKNLQTLMDLMRSKLEVEIPQGIPADVPQQEAAAI